MLASSRAKQEPTRPPTSLNIVTRHVARHYVTQFSHRGMRFLAFVRGGAEGTPQWFFLSRCHSIFPALESKGADPVLTRL